MQGAGGIGPTPVRVKESVLTVPVENMNGHLLRVHCTEPEGEGCCPRSFGWETAKMMVDLQLKPPLPSFSCLRSKEVTCMASAHQQWVGRRSETTCPAKKMHQPVMALRRHRPGVGRSDFFLCENSSVLNVASNEKWVCGIHKYFYASDGGHGPPVWKLHHFKSSCAPHCLFSFFLSVHLVWSHPFSSPPAYSNICSYLSDLLWFMPFVLPVMYNITLAFNPTYTSFEIQVKSHCHQEAFLISLSQLWTLAFLMNKHFGCSAPLRQGGVCTQPWLHISHLENFKKEWHSGLKSRNSDLISLRWAVVFCFALFLFLFLLSVPKVILTCQSKTYWDGWLTYGCILINHSDCSYPKGDREQWEGFRFIFYHKVTDKESYTQRFSIGVLWIR
jgi:hypothetical protein